MGKLKDDVPKETITTNIDPMGQRGAKKKPTTTK
jgi:hypothetical protein